MVMASPYRSPTDCKMARPHSRQRHTFHRPAGGWLTAAGLLAGLGTGPATALELATDGPETLVVTGSNLPPSAAKSSRVQVLTRQDIERSSARNTAELLNRLPAAQNSTPSTVAVGGESFGFAGISLHNQGEANTLVLLNGHRITSFGGQTFTGFAAGVDLSALPLAAIERIEVLPDGASAVYGSDAVAGVVNIITRRALDEGTVSLGWSQPRGGARQQTFSLVKGWGDATQDDHSMVLALSADRTQALRASRRDFAKSGVVTFQDGGRTLRATKLGGSGYYSSPATVAEFDSNENETDHNPFYQATGACPRQQFELYPGLCYYDSVSQLEIVPEQRGQHLLWSGTQTLSGGHHLKSDVLLAHRQTISRIAPSLADLDLTGGPFDTSGGAAQVLAYARLTDLGPRTSDERSHFTQLNLDADGPLGAWAYQLGGTWSRSSVRSRIDGYARKGALDVAVASGLYNPLLAEGQQSTQGLQALQDTRLSGDWNGGLSQLLMLNGQVSRPVAELRGGPWQWSVGGSWRREEFSNRPSLVAQGLALDPSTGDTLSRAGDPLVIPTFGGRRDVWSAFTETSAPVLPTVSLGTSLRHDRYSDVGNTTNGKLNARWQAHPALLLRGAVGSGFRAPTLAQLKAPKQDYGYAKGEFACTAEVQAIADNLGVPCSGKELPILASGNAQLRPETSRQATVGAQWTPNSSWRLGVDWWRVVIHQAVGVLNEDVVRQDPAGHADAFTAIGSQLGLWLPNTNQGVVSNSGLDLEASYTTGGSWGRLSSRWLATRVLTDSYQISPGSARYSSLGRFGENGYVVFPWKAHWTTTLQHQAWEHSLTAHYQSGYQDQPTNVDVLDANGAVIDSIEGYQRRVRSWLTLDWQTRWQVNARWNLGLGVSNLLDTRPPLSIATTGVNRSQAYGHDDRYTSALGRVVTVQASLGF